jgi:hypothetical protein
MRKLSTTTQTRAKWSILRAAAGVVILQGVFLATIHAHPELADAEFGHKLAALRQLIRENPGRSLVLMLGSSRVATGFRPDALSAAAPRSPIVFNFAQVGSGPELAHVTLHRLIKSGIRPDWVFLEYWPPNWTTERHLKTFLEQINIGCLSASDVRVLAHYVTRPNRLYRTWLWSQLSPIVANHGQMLSILASAWTTQDAMPDHRVAHLDTLGWWSPQKSVTADERDRLTERYRKHYEPMLVQFHTLKAADDATRAILDLCRQNQIKASLVLLPEGTAFRSLYSEETLHEVDRYLERVVSQFQVDVVDGRSWIGDTGFLDGHHLLPAGALTFSQRLGREIVQPQMASNVHTVPR